MLKRLLLLALVVGAYALMTTEEVAAQCAGGGGANNIICTNESNTMGSTTLGFDPTVNLMSAVTNTNPASGPCFTCPNGGAAGGTTAGALTASMFGEIVSNSNADLGDLSFNPGVQGMTVPTATECTAVGCNDSGFFTFNLPLPVQDFMSAGTAVTPTTPNIGGVGRAGVKITFNNDFTFNADGSTSFDQTVSQDTFTGGMNGDEVQQVVFQADAASGASSAPATGGGIINWEQTITEGGFILGPLSGSFAYNNTPTFGSGTGASAPTGPGQSNGTNIVLPAP